MQIAKINSNNKVVNTFAISESKVMNLYGEANFENIVKFCNDTFGNTNLFTYVPDLKGVTINEPNVGFNYNPSKKMFFDNQPYNSWTLNDETGIWEAPYKPDTQSDTYGKLIWNENTQRWTAKKTENYGKQVNPDYIMDPITKVWTQV